VSQPENSDQPEKSDAEKSDAEKRVEAIKKLENGLREVLVEKVGSPFAPMGACPVRETRAHAARDHRSFFMSDKSDQPEKSDAEKRVEALEKKLEEVRARKAKREEGRREAELLAQLEAEELDDKAEELADKIVSEGKVRGVDFEVVTGDHQIFVFGRPPKAAYEKFQTHVSAAVHKEAAIPPEQYRNLVRASLLEREGAADKTALDEMLNKYSALAPKIYVDVLMPMAESRTQKRQGK
jgi:hypothetical protein